jgi:hypothetical protein
MSKPLYTASECEKKIREIDERIAELRDMPSSQSVGPYSMSVSGKMEQLQKQREVWKRRLKKAREYEETGSTSGVNGPGSVIT